MLRLEPEGVALVVARRRERVAGRSRGVAWHGWSCGRCRSGVPSDELENTKKIVRNRRESMKAMEKLTITTSGERQRGFPRLRR
jgi:hypothetical protein